MIDFRKGLRALQKALQQGEVTPQDLVLHSLTTIEEQDSVIQAFLRTESHVAKQRAQVVTSTVTTREDNVLAGIPYALKDNMCYEGVETTCASKILAGYIPPHTSTAAHRLDHAGGILIGKVNLDEFAMGSTTENSAYFPTHNPWHPDYVPGGSSGGSAAAVAAGMVPYALGSDTGGSIRQPASFCGVVGLKPTYGRVSRFGLVSYASSLDQIGPITNSVEDAAIVLSVIAGFDERDATCANVPVDDYVGALTGDVKGLRIGVAAELMGEGIDERVRNAVQKAIDLLQSLGATVVPIHLPHLSYAIATYYLIAPAEASSNLARFDGVRYGYRAPQADTLLSMYSKTRSAGFGDEVKRRILLGTYALSSGYYDAYYKRAQQMRTLIAQDFQQAYEQVDVIVAPTSPVLPFRLGEASDDPVTNYLIDICTIPVNLAGLPAISVPCDVVEGLPVGLQIIGNMFDEATILRVADTYEKHSPFAALREAKWGGAAQ